jgi:hypothetical protein
MLRLQKFYTGKEDALKEMFLISGIMEEYRESISLG